MFFQHLDLTHHHPSIHRLAHIVNRQQSDLHGGQCFVLKPLLRLVLRLMWLWKIKIKFR